MFTKEALLLGIGRARQDHIGPVRAAVAMAALIDHEGARPDVDLVGAQVKDHLTRRQRGVQTAIGHRIHVQRADAARGGVQHHEF